MGAVELKVHKNSKQQSLSDWIRGGVESCEMEPLEVLDRLNFDEGIHSVDYLPHFWGGWVGIIGYELAGYFEKLPSRKEDRFGTPDLYMVQVDRLLVYDHKEEILKYIVSDHAPSDYLELEAGDSGVSGSVWKIAS